MKVLVVGSINMDIVINVARFPAAGETVFGDSSTYFAGGKGANQAVAAARLGAEVTMIGAVGDDSFGQSLCQHLAAEGINLDAVAVLPHQSTGTAYITVCVGENQIIVLSGANFALRRMDIERHEHSFQAADLVLSQLEIPLECVLAAAELATKYHKPFLLNPSPAAPVLPDLIRHCTLLTANAHEWQSVLGLPPDATMDKLRQDESENLLITCGVEGVLYRAHGAWRRQAAFKVPVADTTGAGDTFNGALAAFWHEGLERAVHRASAAAALSVSRAGAQSGMPTRNELEYFMHHVP